MAQGNEKAAISAWLAAVAGHGWCKATLQQAAAASGLSAADISRHAADRYAALRLFLGDAGLQAAKAADSAGGTRDRLFDGMMAGFDALQSERLAVLKVWQSRDPAAFAMASALAAPAICRLGTAAGMDVGGLRGQLRLAALAAISARAFTAWRADESIDMAATMAEVDRLLAKAEQAELEGLSRELLGLSGLPNPFDRGQQSSPGLRAEQVLPEPPRSH